MSPQNRSHLSALSLSIFLVILISLVLLYSPSNSTGISQSVKSDATVMALTPASYQTKDDIFLVKNKKLVIGKNCLEFKGLYDKEIEVDLYLLELDDEQAFTKKINRKSIGKRIRFGDTVYTVLTANKNYLKLKIAKTYSTP